MRDDIERQVDSYMALGDQSPSGMLSGFIAASAVGVTVLGYVGIVRPILKRKNAERITAALEKAGIGADDVYPDGKPVTEAEVLKFISRDDLDLVKAAGVKLVRVK